MKWRIILTLLYAVHVLSGAFMFTAHPSLGAQALFVLTMPIFWGLIAINWIGFQKFRARYKMLAVLPLLLLLGS